MTFLILAAVAYVLLTQDQNGETDVSRTDKPWQFRIARAREEAAVIDDLDPRMRRPVRGLLADLRREGHEVLLAYGRRDSTLQEKLVAAGTGSSSSKHPAGLAVDIVALDGWWEGPNAERLWPDIGRFAEQRGLRWGGRFSRYDPAHVEWAG